jgi:hypothetical protein
MRVTQRSLLVSPPVRAREDPGLHPGPLRSRCTFGSRSACSNAVEGTSASSQSSFRLPALTRPHRPEVAQSAAGRARADACQARVVRCARGEWEVRSEGRAATRFHFRTRVTRTSGRGWLCPIRAARSRPGDIDIVTASIDERQLGRRRARDSKRGHPIIGEGGLGALWTPIEQSALHIEHSTRSGIDAARSLRAKCDVAPPRVSGYDAPAAATRRRRRHLGRLAARLLGCGSCRLGAPRIVAAMPGKSATRLDDHGELLTAGLHN